MSARRRRTFRLTRDLVSYMVGIAGIIYETVRNGTDRPTLLLLFGAMIALPKVLGRDEKAAAEEPPSLGPPQAPTQAPPVEEGPTQ